jgi:serine/threonine protein phosphatase PrpC
MSLAGPPLTSTNADYGSRAKSRKSRNHRHSRSRDEEERDTELSAGHSIVEVPNMKINLGATQVHDSLPSPRARSPIEREAYSNRRPRDRATSRQESNYRRRHKHHQNTQQQHVENTSSNATTTTTTILPQLVPAPVVAKRSAHAGSMHHRAPSREAQGASAHEDHETSSASSLRGLKPGNPNWINQDNFFIIEHFDNRDIHMYCVLDGHGELGHLVSRRCRESFHQHIRACNMDIRRAFNVIQNELTSCDIDVRCSGATCVLVAIYNGNERGHGNAPGGAHLVAYNCGDSRAVLGRRNSTGGFVAMALTNDHKPEKPEERKRILSCGGHLGCRQVMVNQPGRGPMSMPVGPCRVWYQYRGDTLGLAMSRSLGDSIVHRCGVTCEPELLEHAIEENDEFIIIATDGVWDVVDSNQAVQLIQNFWSKNGNWSTSEASNWLCKFARSRWEKLAPMIDDITCVIIRLHPFKEYNGSSIPRK